jgi:exopolyphosphatase/guanosine-5'-triphosphate,3'-diphosphate pyrophosphatase
MDIGGGSTEFAIGNTDGPQQTNSLQMGCVSYSTHFFSDGKIYQENTSAALAASRLCLEPEIKTILGMPFDWQVGTSGTVQSIASLCHELYQSDPNMIQREHLEDLLKRLILVGEINAIQFQSLEENRRGILPAGLCICLSVMQQLGIEQMDVGHSSLSEGLLIEQTGVFFTELNY